METGIHEALRKAQTLKRMSSIEDDEKDQVNNVSRVDEIFDPNIKDNVD